MGFGDTRLQLCNAHRSSDYAVAIHKENAARVRGILRHRSWPGLQEEQRQREKAFRAYERAQAEELALLREEELKALERRRISEERAQRRVAAKARRHSLTVAEVASRRALHARICRLAEPRKYPEPMYGRGMIGGNVPHQGGRDGMLPTMGRNGAVYCAGVDRDRIVPPRPALHGTTPPWVGSYSTHHGPRQREEQMAKAAAAYYCAHPALERSASEEAVRQQMLQFVAAEHATEAQQRGNDAGLAGTSGEDEDKFEVDAAQEHGMGNNHFDCEVESIFSHGSSNAPIAATGNKHLSNSSTKESVQLHLRRYGGAMTAPRPRRYGKYAASETLTLPELVNCVVSLQIPKAGSV
ncbi:hypothetical protein JKF63_05682 [Porcisia hertigi]|uniref:Uncharacterized protein n=1 Tax=Porcisia hertigi TaxID=2761500 RepID=A0A836LB22_9TRYP|nr:hypothetical protein JKF63_05682 [Porcisia hertigi]